MTGGNGAYHCVHVSELLKRVDAIELRAATTGRRSEPPRGAATDRGEDPWQPGYEPNRPHRDAGAPGGRATLLLRLEEPIGSQLLQGKNLLDDKLTTSEEYRFNGVKGGFAWKGKTKRHFISRCPILKGILEWAEQEELETISLQRFMEAVGPALSREQVHLVNADI